MFFRIVQMTMAIMLLAFSHQINAIIFITHGFNARNAAWYQPGGDAYEALKIHAADHGHTIEHFEWEQHPHFLGYTAQEQKAAGIKLAQRILNFCNDFTFDPKFPNNHKIIVVAHSYGGLVCYHASVFLGSLNIASLEPSQKSTMQTSKPDSEAQTSLLFRIKLFVTNLWQKPNSKKNPTPTPEISALVTLGTPHTAYDPLPHTAGVKRVVNIHSPADTVASTAPTVQLFSNRAAQKGTYGAPLPPAIMRHHPNAHDVCLLAGENLPYQVDALDSIIRYVLKTPALKGFTHLTIHSPVVMQQILPIVDHIEAQTSKDKNDIDSRRFIYTIHGNQQPQSCASAA